MENEKYYMIKVTTDEKQEILEFDSPYIHFYDIEDALDCDFFDSVTVRPIEIGIRYAFFVDDQGYHKELPVNLIGNSLYGADGLDVVGDILIGVTDPPRSGDDPDVFAMDEYQLQVMQHYIDRCLS